MHSGNSYSQKLKLQLNDHWNNEMFLKSILTQISKDFAQFNLDPRFYDKEPTDYEALCTTIKMQLMLLMDKNPALLLQLIYTVDIPETVFKSIVDSSDNMLSELAEIILCREALKIYFRMNLG